MREAAFSIRERHLDAEIPRVPSFFARHRPTWGTAAGGTVLLAGVGAFDTGATAAWTLYSYWTILMFAGGALIALGAERLDRMSARNVPAGLIGAAIVLATTLSMTPLVFLLSALMLGNDWEFSRLPQLATQSLLVTTIFYAVHRLAERRDTAALRPAEGAHAAEPGSRPQATIRSRLPFGFADAEIEALQAEDHYLRVHTDRGSTLILMPLSEALAAAEAAGGRRTHRSWWAARDAVVAGTRRGGRASLMMKSGLEVPVSRTFAPTLRREGWFRRGTPVQPAVATIGPAGARPAGPHHPAKGG